MSVFRVKLANNAQGQLDVNMVSGKPNPVSLQRTVYVTGPNLTWRKLNDGDVFTDSNYYKRFCVPYALPEDSFLELVSDDGSVYAGQNMNQSLTNNYPRSYNVTVASSSTYATPANVVDITGDTGGTAVFAQIANTGANAAKVRLNGLATSIIDLPAGTTQIFNNGELRLNKIEFNSVPAGATTVQILVSVLSPNNS